jgi:hypothetical protein
MSDEVKKRRGSVGGLVLLLLGGLTLYVLSSGPAFWFAASYPNRTLQTLLMLTYSPLILASGALPVVGRLWEACLELWSA